MIPRPPDTEPPAAAHPTLRPRDTEAITTLDKEGSTVNISTERETALKRLKARREFNRRAAVATLVAIVTVTIWAAAGAGYFWPVWPMIGFVIALLKTGWQAYGPRERPITEDQIAKEMRG
jgi:hypothetical protein